MSATVKLTWLKPVMPARSAAGSDIAVGHPAAAHLEDMARDVAGARGIEQEADAGGDLVLAAEALHRRAAHHRVPVEAACVPELSHRRIVDVARGDGVD